MFAIFNHNYLHKIISGNNELCVQLKLERKYYIFRMNLFIEIPLLLQDIRWPSIFNFLYGFICFCSVIDKYDEDVV